MKELLKKYFGYDEFRPLQEEIINNTLEKNDSLVLMPTGGGKSICYQIPALNFEGLTLIISPLISLMKDQVDSLKANGVNAEYINSTLNALELRNIQDKIKRKEVKLLYVAPERLALEEFKIFLSQLKISLIAIDEAHCISEWGHDFRPDYRNLKSLRVLFSETPIIALTATATERVRQDIVSQLVLRNPKIFISSFNRKNLNLMVVEKKNAVDKIVELLKEYKDESVIIYCFSRRDCENIAEILNNKGFGARAYHAGLDAETRRNNQDLFIKNKIDIIVATIAFGMGINKPNVRLIVHHTFPKTLEGYYQEIGRAGRDGLPSDCILFYSRGDKRKHEFFINQINDETAKINAEIKLNQVMQYCEDRACKRKHILRYLGEDLKDLNCGACDSCLNILRPEVEEEKQLISSYEEHKYNPELFEELRILRRNISSQRNVAPFIIFGDVALREMCIYLPTTDKEFIQIKGVGYKKLEDFGESFMNVIKEHLKHNPLEDEKKPETGGVDYHKRLEKIKEKFNNAYEPWKKEDDEMLKNLYYSDKKSISEISFILKRQPNAIRSRLKKISFGDYH